MAKAPSNIALIKYMGKADEKSNIPTNASFSYTLDHLFSLVELSLSDAGHDAWEPLNHADCQPLALSQAGQQRFLSHLAMLKAHFACHHHFTVRSANNFPAGSGLASSASSFAALTRCAVQAFTQLNNIEKVGNDQLARLSRLGSGSSCRSFFSPWALWQDEVVEAVELPYETLIHRVIMIKTTEKKISSSRAHALVRTSPHFAGRVQRAEKRLQQLLTAFRQRDWPMAYQVCWDEFMDMHRLFSTASPSFQYIEPASQAVLDSIQRDWQQHGDGPIVTMDAGPNIHLLFRPGQRIPKNALAKNSSIEVSSARVHTQ